MRLLKMILALAFVLVIGINIGVSADKEIICASTTSTENSGLFGYILPMFEKKTGIKVKVVARGTGAAIEMGKRGDADMLFVQAKEQELKVVEEGYFVNIHDVMYNDFVIIASSVRSKLSCATPPLFRFASCCLGGIVCLFMASPADMRISDKRAAAHPSKGQSPAELAGTLNSF